jgi:hypothetical protein
VDDDAMVLVAIRQFLESVPNVRPEKPLDAHELREIVSSIAERPAVRTPAAA